MGCVYDSGVLTAGGGVRSKLIRDGIFDAEGGSHSSSANRRRFSTRPISKLSALDFDDAIDGAKGLRRLGAAGGQSFDADCGMSGGRRGGGSGG